MKNIFVVGDSHSIYYYYSNRINHHWLGWADLPVTIYKFNNIDIALYNIVEKYRPGDVCKINIKEGDIVMFCLGWNDIQKNIYKYNSSNYIDFLKNLADSYINKIKTYRDRFNIYPIINCIYPATSNNTMDGLVGPLENRIEYTLLMNSYLYSKCIIENIPFFDIYDKIQLNHLINPIYLDKDQVHLDKNNKELMTFLEDKLVDIANNYK